MIGAMCVGWVLKDRKLHRGTINIAITVDIMILMAIIGAEIGSSPSVLKMFGSIFLDALVITFGAVGGTIAMAWLFNRYILKTKIEPRNPKKGKSKHTFSVMIISVFAIGVIVGRFVELPDNIADASMWALYLLMCLVGLSIGSDIETLQALKNQPWRVIFVPLATILGTYLGIIIICPLVGLSLTDQLAIGSGFGYYSISSVLLSELRSPEIGAIALMVNVVRELFAVSLAPIISKRFSPIALISCAGASTIDISLPVVVANCGATFVGMSIFHGACIDMSVPFLVSFFGSLGA